MSTDTPTTTETETETESGIESKPDAAAGDSSSSPGPGRESGFGQPQVDGLTARVVRALPGVGVDTAESTLDQIPVSKAYRNAYAIERDDGTLIGAIRITPASKSMVDDIDPDIQQFAANLSASTASEGMLVDIPRRVDYSARRDRYHDLARRLDDSDSRVDRLEADLAEERAAVSNYYEQTSSIREHYLVLKVDQDDAVRALVNEDFDGGLASVPGVGVFVRERRKSKLADGETLTSTMIDLMSSRIEKMARFMGYLDGITATPLPASEFAQVIADYYRAEDVYAFRDFGALVRESPVATSESGDPDPGVRYATGEGGDPLVLADDDERVRQFKSLLAPDSVDWTPRRVEVGGRRRTASLAITGVPSRPPRGFLDPLYEHERPGVDVAIATHFERKDQDKAERDAKGQENALRTLLEDVSGTSLEETFEARFEEADRFVDGLAQSDHAAFDVGIYVTVSVDADLDDREDTLDDALDDIRVILKEECGLDRKQITHQHEKGWQTTSPTCSNELGTNLTLRADGLARQFPYGYKNLRESGGVRVGVHEYLREPTTLDIFNRENGYDGGIYGMKGSGKTTTLQELAAANKLRYDAEGEEFTLVLATPLQDFEGLCEAFGGEHIVVGGDTGVNPLATHWLPSEKLKRLGVDAPWTEMLERFGAFVDTYYAQMGLSGLGEKRGIWLQAAKEANYRKGIRPGDAASYRNESPTIRDVKDVLVEIVDSPGEFVDAALADDEKTREDLAETARQIVNHDVEAFAEDGQFAHFCEPMTVDFDDADVIYLDYQRYESDESAGGLDMQMRLSNLYQQAKATDGKTMFAVDEFHYMLRNPRSAQFFKLCARHGRHWDLAVWVATQEFADLFAETDDEIALTDSMRVMFNNQAMQIYQYTKEMNAAWGEELGLSERSQQYIRDADAGKKTDGYANALLVVDEDQYPLRVEMSDHLNPRQFAIYQYDPTRGDHADDFWEYLAEYRDRDGRDVCDWRWSA